MTDADASPGMHTRTPALAADAEAEGAVYVVVQGSLGTNVVGCLLLDTGEAPWQHCSSDMQWLLHDLTCNFGREDDLRTRYPQGYRVIVVDRDGEIPPEVLARNSARNAKETL